MNSLKKPRNVSIKTFCFVNGHNGIFEMFGYCCTFWGTFFVSLPSCCFQIAYAQALILNYVKGQYSFTYAFSLLK